MTPIEQRANDYITLTPPQWENITENNIYPSFLTSNQERIISKALFAYNIDGNIEDLNNDIISAGIEIPDLGQE